MRSHRLVSCSLAVLTLLAGCSSPLGDAEEIGASRSALCPVNDDSCFPDPPDPPDPPAPPPVPSVQQIASHYTSYDMNADGVAEIHSISLMSFEPTQLNAGTNGLVIVLVDPRLVDSFTGSRRAEVLARLETYRNDLMHEGFQTRFLLADVYDGAMHQDGRTLLALRRFLKEVKGSYPAFKGVTLVGSFPDATLIRRPLVKFVNRDITFDHGGAAHGDYLDMHPERINARADLILGDLDGNWESLYHEAPMRLEWVRTMPPAGPFPTVNTTFTSSRYSILGGDWEDFFYVDDAQAGRTAGGTGDTITVHVTSFAERHPELTAADRTLPNPLARVELLVSRINPKGLAYTPSISTGELDINGRALIGLDGKPQMVQFTHDVSVAWTWDRVLEQRILIDYFDRNHAFRLGADRYLPFRTAAVRAKNSGLDTPSSFDALLGAASSSFGAPYAVDDATLYDYATWLEQPAVLRGIAAHSSTFISEFGANAQQDLTRVLGNKVWAFAKESSSGGTMIYPSVNAVGPTSSSEVRDADYGFYRTLFENQMLVGAGQRFYVHGGCDVNLPAYAETQPYSGASYGMKNNADMVLFFGNGLAEYARGKVFYDVPDGFAKAIHDTGRFGNGWTGHAAADALDGDLDPGVTGDPTKAFASKKSYYWGLLGDWTLKLRY